MAPTKSRISIMNQHECVTSVCNAVDELFLGQASRQTARSAIRCLFDGRMEISSQWLEKRMNALIRTTRE